MLLYTLPLLAPLLLLLAACYAFRGPGLRPAKALRLGELAGIAGIAVSVACLVVEVMHGSGTGILLGFAGFGFSSRIDPVTVTMLLLVSVIGWVVLRYSATYLDGELRQGAFTGWLCLTLAAVLFLVQSGNLVQLVFAWIATGFSLNKLLVFYTDRQAAIRAAHKHMLFDRIGYILLLLAALLLAIDAGTGDVALLLDFARSGQSGTITIFAAMLLALCALIKSAQFPVHVWLPEVMETPTPVSATLHAGVINAGGFLLIRFADIMLTAPGVLAILVMIGGFTAIFGSMVMLTQSAVKTSLAWSTIAQMGFMILQCGLALFPIALLHIVAHSLYKAHAFLSSGSAVQTVALIRRPGPIAIPNVAAVGRAFLVALLIYVIVGSIFGFVDKSPQAIALGAILIFGVAYLLAQGLADQAPEALTRRTIGYSTAAAVGYFALQSGADALMSSILPETPVADPLEWALIVLILVSFGLVAVAQAMFPLWANHPASGGLRVHLSNGLYVNALFDRWLNRWSTAAPDLKNDPARKAGGAKS